MLYVACKFFFLVVPWASFQVIILQIYCVCFNGYIIHHFECPFFNHLSINSQIYIEYLSCVSYWGQISLNKTCQSFTSRSLHLIRVYIPLLMLIICSLLPYFALLQGVILNILVHIFCILMSLCYGLVEPKGYLLKITNFCQLVSFSFIVFILHFPNPWKSCACFNVFIGHLYYSELPILILCPFVLLCCLFLLICESSCVFWVFIPCLFVHHWRYFLPVCYLSFIF